MTAHEPGQTECFSLLERDGYAELTMKRAAALNTMLPSFWTDLPAIVRALDNSGRARALILASSGRHFSAGMDLSVFEAGTLSGSSAHGRERLRNQILSLQDSFSALERARFPVIAAIQGGCIGGAVDMVCACDLRYATRDAFFQIQEINIGMMADVGTLQRMPKLLPEAVVRELAYTGDRLPASEAHRLGFVNQLFDTHEAMLLAVRATAKRIAAKSALAISGSKDAITFVRDNPVGVALHMIANWQSGMLDMEEVAAAMVAVKAGREAQFASLAQLPSGVTPDSK